MANVIRELNEEALRSSFALDAFDFQTTNDLAPEENPIGQQRAIDAIDFGLKIKRDGYNLYISGLPGTGRNTVILKAIEKIAAQQSVPDDICYVFNFINPDEPRVIQLPAGAGNGFRQDMDNFVKDVEREVRKAFISEDYEKHKTELIDKFEKEKDRMSEELNKYAQTQGFIIERGMMGILLLPLSKDHEMTDSEYVKLGSKEKSEINRKQDEVYEKIHSFAHWVKERDRALKNDLEELDRSVGLSAIGSLIDDLKKKYTSYLPVTAYLEEVKNDILKNLESFKKEPSKQISLTEMLSASREDVLFKYQVNLLVDNQKTKGAPVIVEDNPTYYNLVGRVEHRAKLGVLLTDFSMIKAGAVHRASGGYLILQANDLFKDYFAWDALKTIIKRKKAKIENVAERYGYLPTAGLKPQPVDVDFKVIIIGSPRIYYLLHWLDEDFIKTFKVKADFDTAIAKNDDAVGRFINFISSKCKEEKLLPFDKPAVGEMIHMASRLISHQHKLTARFAEIVDLMREADFWARQEGSGWINGKHVKKAVEEKVYRSDMVQRRLQELFEDGTLLVETKGEKTGQINGLSVLDVGDYAFGIPSRITARTYLGRGNIINIEREIEMSGRIHSKGVLIIAGFLGHQFANDKLLAVSASLCFEQTYEEVEGDSASSAEIYCLLSSLGSIPLKQGIAVTGSVDQHGGVQAIGGVNEKIEGFFEVCRLKGLQGQGVIIPEANVKNLMLKDDVIEAVKAKKFHIYPVKTIDEGIAILTGLEAGQQDRQGRYPENTVYARVDEQLRKYAEIAAKMGKEVFT